MRNLEQSVGMHRRLEGVGKSAPGEDVGTFDFHWAHNRHSANRKVVCTVHRGEGWECLNILLYDEKGSKRMWERPPPAFGGSAPAAIVLHPERSGNATP